MNDNVFSCKVDIDISKEEIYEYYAVVGDNGNDAIVSNTVKIDVYAGFTEKELFDNEEVFTAIDNLQNSDEFKTMNLGNKADATYRLLVELSENGTEDAPYSLIKKGSIYFDTQNYQYTFLFQSGGIVVIPLIESDRNFSGVNRNGSSAETLKNTTTISPATLQMIPANSTVNKAPLGKALHLFGFSNDERFEKGINDINQAKDDWNLKGLETTVDIEVSVEDFKKLEGYDVIIFNMHGNRVQYQIPNKQPEMRSAFILNESSDRFSNKKYFKDLNELRIGRIKVGFDYRYCVFPSFFDFYYDDDNGLDGSIVFMANCHGMGTDVVDSTLSNQLLGCGAETVVGFISAVVTEYGTNILISFINNLCSGDTAEVAL